MSSSRVGKQTAEAAASGNPTAESLRVIGRVVLGHFSSNSFAALTSILKYSTLGSSPSECLWNSISVTSVLWALQKSPFKIYSSLCSTDHIEKMQAHSAAMLCFQVSRNSLRATLQLVDNRNMPPSCLPCISVRLDLLLQQCFVQDIYQHVPA